MPPEEMVYPKQFQRLAGFADAGKQAEQKGERAPLADVFDNHLNAGEIEGRKSADNQARDKNNFQEKPYFGIGSDRALPCSK